jgi:hypothetical protein
MSLQTMSIVLSLVAPTEAQDIATYSMQYCGT